MAPGSQEALLSLAFGFACAGLIASAFEAMTQRRAGFELLQSGGIGAAACVPVVVFSAPFLIIRNTVRGRRFERRPVGFVMAATMIACFWSLMSGRVLIDIAMRIGHLV
jgi:hypothetical protein